MKKSDTSHWTLNRLIAFNLVSYFLFKCHRLRISTGTKSKGGPLSLRAKALAFIVFPFLMLFLSFTLSPHPEQGNLSFWLDFSNDSNSPAVVTLVSVKEISVLNSLSLERELRKGKGFVSSSCWIFFAFEFLSMLLVSNSGGDVRCSSTKATHSVFSCSGEKGTPQQRYKKDRRY